MKPKRRKRTATADHADLSHVDRAGRVRMVDVSSKPPTARRAVAEGRVRISPLLAGRIAANSLAKGNLLETARLAGIAAAKRTDELIPLCHSLPLEHIDVDARLDGSHVVLRAEVAAFARTGVEMEALTAVAVAALAVIDMGKAVDPAMVIEQVRLISKTGGTRKAEFGITNAELKKDAHVASGTAAPAMTVAILTVSDRCSLGQAVDRSGPALAEMARTRLGARVVAVACVPDDKERIARRLRDWASSRTPPDLILTTGGTGLSPRDVTPEATAAVLDRPHPALLELARHRCLARTPRAFLSRGQAGTIGRSLVINLPGSPGGATETLDAILDILPHALETLHSARSRRRKAAQRQSGSGAGGLG